MSELNPYKSPKVQGETITPGKPNTLLGVGILAFGVALAIALVALADFMAD